MRNKKVMLSAVVMMFVVVVITVSRLAVVPSHQATGSEKMHVVASFYPLYYFATRIGSDKVDVTNITPAGAEPHEYEPTAQDVARIESSDLLILNGGGLEAWGENISRNLDPQKTRIVIAGEALTTEEMEEDGKAMTDPHIWLSPKLAKTMVDRIAEGFVVAHAQDTAFFHANAAALKADLDRLDTEYGQSLANCATKDIVTSHMAFGYLADAYGLRQRAIAGLSPDAEPSPRQLTDVAAFAKQNRVKYIFFESLVSPKLSETIAAEIGAKTLVLNPLEGLTNDELNQGKNYLTEMKSNLVNLRIALACATPLK